MSLVIWDSEKVCWLTTWNMAMLSQI